MLEEEVQVKYPQFYESEVTQYICGKKECAPNFEARLDCRHVPNFPIQDRRSPSILEDKVQAE